MPLLVGRLIPLPPGVSARRLGVAAVLVATLPDLDILTFLFDAHPLDPWGHRGVMHSLLFAGALAFVAAALFFRGPAFGRVFALLFLAGASHGLLDALTRGDSGVALFAPFVDTRFLSPLRLVPVCPLGVGEYLSRFGAITLGNELLWIDLPLWLITEAVRRRRAEKPFGPLSAATAAWLLIVTAVWLRWPYLYALPGARVIKGYGVAGGDDDLAGIPRDDLPDGRLVTRFDELRSLGLFGKRLAPDAVPWSTGFFPAWYGGEAGRWSDSRATLIGRTLFGFSPLSPAAAQEWLERDNGRGLAPSEKYDVARGDYSFAATRESLTRTHNARPLPRFWYGLCNGAAAAAIDRPEPFRAVDVQTPDGHVVRFHPVDVKALLAKSYYWQANTGILGGSCDVVGFDTGRECSMNPGGLVIGALNYLGRAHRSFMMDVYPTLQSQNYAVAAGRVDITREPYVPGDEPFETGLRARVDRLVDVELAFDLSSTTLRDDLGAEPDSADGTRFKKVGVHVVPFHWSATLALDPAGELIGGRWRGDPANGPDNAAFVGGGPLLDGGVTLEVQPQLEWPFIDALARASVEEGRDVPTLDADGGRKLQGD